VAYCLTFCILAGGLVATAFDFRGWVWLCLWPALSYFLAGLAYAGLGPRVFGKRPDGSMAPWAAFPLAFYLAVVWTVWHLRRLLVSEKACVEIAPGLWIGRRPAAGDVPPGVETVVDLAAEFPEIRTVTAGRRYLLRPILDGSAPSDQALAKLVTELAALSGPMLIHCALGHGRSVLVAAALLLETGRADDLEELLKRLRRARPQMFLTKPQMLALKRFATARRTLKAVTPPPLGEVPPSGGGEGGCFPH
jgi:protein-tyrosine phosphatase